MYQRNKYLGTNKRTKDIKDNFGSFGQLIVRRHFLLVTLTFGNVD